MKTLDIGGFRPATAGVEVRRQGKTVRVVGLKQDWAFAARCDIDHTRLSGDISIDLQVSVQAGRITAGVLNAAGDAMITEVSVPARENAIVKLDVGPARAASCVVLRTDQGSGEAPRFLIHDINVGLREARAQQPHLNVDPRVDAQWPASLVPYSVEVLRNWTEAELAAHMTGNKMRDNLILNKWEFTHGKTVLKSYPWQFSVPFVLCNSRCEFCAAWQMKGKAPLLDFMRQITPVIQRCVDIGLVGWGEPLIHPEFAEILQLIKDEADPAARVALTTNGTRLDEWTERLLAANVMDYAFSVHAATAATHRDLMGLPEGDFERVIAAVKTLASRKKQYPHLSVEMVMVVTRQNIAEIPAFIDMCEDLGVQQVYLKTLMPMDQPREGLDYHRLPPYRHPDFQALRFKAVMAMQSSRLIVRGTPQDWSRPIFPARYEAEIELMPLTPREERNVAFYPSPETLELLPAGEPIAEPAAVEETANRYGRKAPLYCHSPYTSFYPGGFDRRVIPCIYIDTIEGHEAMHLKPSMRFEDLWNSPAMVALRKHLYEGPLMSTCLKCPFFC